MCRHPVPLGNGEISQFEPPLFRMGGGASFTREGKTPLRQPVPVARGHVGSSFLPTLKVGTLRAKHFNPHKLALKPKKKMAPKRTAPGSASSAKAPSSPPDAAKEAGGLSICGYIMARCLSFAAMGLLIADVVLSHQYSVVICAASAMLLAVGEREQDFYPRPSLRRSLDPSRMEASTAYSNLVLAGRVQHLESDVQRRRCCT